MKKILGSRGTGKSYSIYSYAILNECDIIVPTRYNINYAIKAVKNIINKKYCDIKIDSINISERDCATIWYHSKDKDNMYIRIFSASDVSKIQYGNGRYIVCDELSCCMRAILLASGYKLTGFSDSID